MNVQPLKDRVLVERKLTEEKTPGGIYIPDTAKEKMQEGTVTAVGPDVKDLKAGDRVLFENYSGTEINRDGREYLILNLKDVLAILK